MSPGKLQVVWEALNVNMWEPEARVHGLKGLLLQQ